MVDDLRSKLSSRDIIGAFIFIIVLIFFSNMWIEREMKKRVEYPLVVVSRAKAAVIEEETKPVITDNSQEVIKRTRIETGSNYVESVFFVDGQQIAVERVWPNGKVEVTGQIPDGTVKFLNEIDHTYGEEHYKEGRRSGVSQIHTSSGQLLGEVEYKEGKLVKSTEYYPNGQLRFEVDYTDARGEEEAWQYKDFKELGVGKLYYNNGKLKYEWNLTKSDPVGFKKSYNRNGRLRYEEYYDEIGQVTQRNRPLLESEETVENVVAQP